MSVNAITALLALMPPADGKSSAPPYVSILPMVLFIFVLYLVLIRPQQRRAKEHDLLVKGLKAGDKVVTSSGIIGVVIAVKDKSLSIRSADTKLEVLKSAITEITERSNEGESTHS